MFVPLFVALLFVIAVPAAWVLGQKQTTPPAVIIRSADSGVATKTIIGTVSSKPLVMPKKAMPQSSKPVPSLSATPAPSPTVLPLPSPTAGPGQSNMPPVKATPPTLPRNLIQDPGYEMQTSNLVSSPWTNVGNDTIELNTGNARSGANDARLSPISNFTWTGINQLVNVEPFTSYTLSVYVHTSDDINANLALCYVIGVHGPNLASVHFGPSGAGYALVSLTFNSGFYDAVNIQIGFIGAANTWLLADDWYLHS